MNKTVPDKARIEHRALFWVLKHYKFTPAWKNGYSHKKDYYGFFPEYFRNDSEKDIRRIDLMEIDSFTHVYDMAYFADCYGVQYSDFQIERPSDLPNLIYGGLNQNDYLFLQKMAEKKKPVILEYNFFAAPTSDLIRTKIEQLFGIYWSGWKGKYFGSLSKGDSETDVPEWVVTEWELQNKDTWIFNKPGIILINSGNTIVVLEKDTHLDIEVPLIITDSEFAKAFKMDEMVYFTGWFDITFALQQNDVTSFFEISANANGTSLLRKYGIPARFPAVIMNKNDKPFVYLAGNYARIDIDFLSASLAGIENLILPQPYGYDLDNKNFFWRFYKPLIGNFIQEHSD